MYTGPNTVTNGLVLNLDAANIKSYPGSGTTWSDLSGNNNSGTLINGPTFGLNGGGSIVFDGLDDYINTGLNVAYTEGTVSIWVYPRSNGASNFFVYTADAGTGTWTHQITLMSDNKLRTYFFDSGQKYFDSVSTVSLYSWYNVVLWWRNSNQCRCYLNGNLEGSVGIGTAWTSGNKFLFGKNTGGNPTASTNYLAGSISIAQIYNRALSVSEIQQNYNAQKSRFGL